MLCTIHIIFFSLVSSFFPLSVVWWCIVNSPLVRRLYLTRQHYTKKVPSWENNNGVYNYRVMVSCHLKQYFINITSRVNRKDYRVHLSSGGNRTRNVSGNRQWMHITLYNEWTCSGVPNKGKENMLLINILYYGIKT
jgi:hypothetical protein